MRKLYVSYLEKGSSISLKDVPGGLPYFWFNPKEGTYKQEGVTEASFRFTTPENN